MEQESQQRDIFRHPNKQQPIKKSQNSSCFRAGGPYNRGMKTLFKHPKVIMASLLFVFLMASDDLSCSVGGPSWVTLTASECDRDHMVMPLVADNDDGGWSW